MVFLRRVRKILNLLFHGDAVETELDAEVQAFYQTIVDRYIERGLPEPEARRLARIKFGHPENVKEEVRDSRTGAALASTLRNVNYAFRTMRKAPLFALVTILTLESVSAPTQPSSPSSADSSYAIRPSLTLPH